MLELWYITRYYKNWLKKAVVSLIDVEVSSWSSSSSSSDDSAEFPFFFLTSSPLSSSYALASPETGPSSGFSLFSFSLFLVASTSLSSVFWAGMAAVASERENSLSLISCWSFWWISASIDSNCFSRRSLAVRARRPWRLQRLSSVEVNSISVWAGKGKIR